MSTMWGYPSPNLINPYVYLKSLGTDPYPPSKKMLQQASSYIQQGMTQFKSTKEQGVKKGLEFLANAAAVQRAHELSFIEHRINDLKQLGKLGSEEEEICNALIAMKNGEIDYKLFIETLNMVITNLDHYRTRVKAFTNTAVSNIPQVRMVEGLATAIGSYADSRDSFYYSQEEAVRQLALKWFKEYGSDFVGEQIVDGVTGAKNMAAALAIVTQQMARYIYDKRKLKERHVSKADKKGKFADFKSPEEFVKFINDIDLNDFEKYTNMSKALEDEQLLKEIQNLYGIDYDKTVYANNRRIRESASKEVQEVKALLNNEPLATDNFKDLMNGITVYWNGKIGGNRKLAFENELISAIAPAFDAHLHTGGWQTGTDMLLGYIGMDINLQDKDSGEITNALHTIAGRIRREAAINNVEKTSKIYLEEMDKLNDKLTGLKDSFIIHETTKNYNTLERGKWPSGMDRFSGREMNLFHYIDAICSMGDISGFNTDWLRFISYNLATDAIGAAYKSPLETVFAIFAGIIMFDDFAVIGQEVTNEMTQYNNTQALHLYRLQDTYFPASMFLDATYKAMKGAEDTLLEGNGFITTITVPTINYYIDDNFTPDISYGLKFIDRWPGVRSAAESGTTIHLQFASEFLRLMSSLSQSW